MGKAGAIFSAVTLDFPHKRTFDGDVFYLLKHTPRKDKAQEIAKEQRAKGYYIRITYNKYAKRYLVWRG